MADLDHVIAALVDYMDENGRHDAPDILVSNYEVAVGALCSVGLLRRDDASVSFVHQGYFDHLVAERVLRDAFQRNNAPIRWVKANQSFIAGHGGSLEEGLARIEAPTLILYSENDLVFAPEGVRQTAELIEDGGADVELVTLEGKRGHLDGILAIDQAGERIRAFLAE